MLLPFTPLAERGERRWRGSAVEKMATPKYTVPALDKALDVIELLSESTVSMSQAEISRALDRKASEIFRTLAALESRGYIRRTQAGRYRLTLKLFELGRMHSPYEELFRVALPIMRKLSEELKETCHLTTLRDGEIVVLAQHESPTSVRLSVEVGSRHSPITTTSGRIILSAMDEEERTGFLKDYTDFSSQSDDAKEAFLKRVRDIERRGYEIVDGERFVGGLDIGVLVGMPGSTIKAAIIVATLRGADGPDRNLIRDAVIQAGKKMTQLLGMG